MRMFLFFFLLFFIAHSHFVKAQIPEETLKDIKFQHFTSANGLSQRSVMAILQDKKGYLWFGTRDGLNKFDGNKFIVYRHNLSDPESLSNNNIHSIHEDSYGNLWVGTQIGLNKYNPKTDKFIRYKNADTQTATENIIRGILQIDKELLWAATDNGIVQVNIKTDDIKRIKKKGDNHNSLSDNKVRSFLKTKDGNIWICNTRYIDIYDPAKRCFKRLDYPQFGRNNIHLNDLPTLFSDQRNSLWLGYEQGLALYDPHTGSFADFVFKGKKAVNAGVRSICEDLSGNLWIGSYSGLYILNSERSALNHIVHDENNANSLSQNSIYKIIRDSRGDMWLGTWADGLNYYNRDNGPFKNISFGSTVNKLNYKVVSGLAEDYYGNLWIGTEGGGLNFYNSKKKKFTYHKNVPNNEYSLSANNIKSVIIDKNENLWVGIHDGGLNFLNTRQKSFKFERIDFGRDSELSLKAYKVLTLFEDKNGNIWVGTLTGGLIFYDVKNKRLSKIDKDIKAVMSIAQTADPDVLLVGGDQGLETINIGTKRTRRIQVRKTSGETPSLYVNCLFIDNFSNYWIGTEGEGLFMYDPKTKKVKSYGIEDGLPNDIIYGILSDNNGYLWISTNNGICRLNIESGNVKNYDQSDGLQGNEFNYGSFYQTRDKRLFFGGTNGLTYFDPNDFRKNNFIPNIDINNIDVNNAPYLKITDSVEEIVLSYDKNNFSIDYTALSYMQPEKNEFAYILEGNDKKWNKVGKQRKAVYTNIGEGEYIFRVKGANNDGVWNEKGDSIRIKVLPPPWRTWWAYLLYLAALLGVFVYIRKLILLRIKERKEKEQADQIHQLKLRLFTDISHDFRTPLTLIIGPLEKMLSKSQGDSYVRKQHEIMLKNARMLLQLVNQILDFRKIESGKLLLQHTKSNIVPFVEDIKVSFDALAEKKNIDYKISASKKSIQVWFDKIKLKNILFNLLSNAFKFSDDNSKVRIIVSTSSRKINSKLINYVKISVVNFGYVIPKEKLNLIFDQFYQLDTEKKNLGSGIGLSLTKRLVELHKGKILVKSSENEGTRFSVLLRLGDKHLSHNELINEDRSVSDNMLYIDEEVTDLRSELDQNPSLKQQFQDGLQTLLIVEDNLDLQQFIREIFSDKYNIFTASNGEQALAIANENTVDLIISDVYMPVMDGFEFCKTIKSTLLTSHIPVILLTAKTSPPYQEKGYSLGADAYVTKPFNARLLELRVNNLLETRASLIRKFKKEAILEPKKLTVTSPDEIFLEKAIAVVERNISNQEFNASMLIEQMNMSRTVIFTKMKALTGQNLTTFIRTIRLKKAALLISQTEMNVSQVAYEVGFNDLKYFRECFKDFFKETPSNYKKKQKEAQ